MGDQGAREGAILVRPISCPPDVGVAVCPVICPRPLRCNSAVAHCHLVLSYSLAVICANLRNLRIRADVVVLVVAPPRLESRGYYHSVPTGRTTTKKKAYGAGVRVPGLKAGATHSVPPGRRTTKEEDIWRGCPGPRLESRGYRHSVPTGRTTTKEKDVWRGRLGPRLESRGYRHSVPTGRTTTKEEDIWRGCLGPRLESRGYRHSVPSGRITTKEEGVWRGRLGTRLPSFCPYGTKNYKRRRHMAWVSGSPA